MIHGGIMKKLVFLFTLILLTSSTAWGQTYLINESSALVAGIFKILALLLLGILIR